MTTSTTLIQLKSYGMGIGPQELQLKLLRTYLTLLLENETRPGALVFYTDAVKLLTRESPVLDLLQQLEARQVRLIACSTCINFFGIQDQIAAGIVGGMPDIMAAQEAASKIIDL